MNLQNLGVQEMNAQELTTVDGGNWIAESIGKSIGAVVGFAVGLVLVTANIVAEKIVDGILK